MQKKKKKKIFPAGCVFVCLFVLLALSLLGNLKTNTFPIKTKL